MTSLTLNFLSGTLDSRISLTRALNTATRVNPSGFIETIAANTPRFNYNPTTLQPQGLLIEETRSNLFLQSSGFSTGSWTRPGVTVTPDAVISPDGGINASKIIPTAVSGLHYLRQNVAVSSGNHTVSFFAQAGEYSAAWATMDGGSNQGFFNLTGNGTASTTGPLNVTIVKRGSYYFCTVTQNRAAGTAPVFIGVANPAGNLTFTGDGTSGIYVWGAQFESGSFATSHIPTTTTALTRNADVATITGSDFTGFWNSVQGGTSVQATPSTVSGFRPLVQFDDGTANEIIALRGNTTNPELYIVDGGTPQAQLDAGTIAANTAYSLTGWWATDDCKARQDAGAVVTDTTATIPTVTQMRIGSDGTNYLNGTIATIDYYDSFFGRPIYTRRKNKVFPSLL
jgi:hypothetical protein